MKKGGGGGGVEIMLKIREIDASRVRESGTVDETRTQAKGQVFSRTEAMHSPRLLVRRQAQDPQQYAMNSGRI